MAGELVFITGATGHVGFAVFVAALKAGYRVRASVRRPEKGEELKNHRSVNPFADRLEIVIVPDITVQGAFDGVLEGVTYIEHVARPIPSALSFWSPLLIAARNTNLETDIVAPVIDGTLSILKSALNINSLHRVVITSSVAAVYSLRAASSDAEEVCGPDSRVRPLPTPPYGTLATAYRASKILALAATENFLVEEKPRFSVVNIMPAYVIGANELVTDASKVALGSNGLVMGIILGKKFPDPRPAGIVHVQDVARIHIEALDMQKVPGNKSFILVSGTVAFDDAFDIVMKYYPDKVADGTLPLGGSITPIYNRFDASETLQTFGPLLDYEEQVKSLVSHYFSLISEAKA